METEAVTGVEAEVTPQSQEGQEKGPESDLKRELETLNKRYSDSSTEGIRLARENAALQAKLEVYSKSSLKEEKYTFPQEDKFVTDRVAKGIPEEAAREDYRRDKWAFDQFNFLHTQNQALANRVRFSEQNATKLAVEANPNAKEASEFWADNPVMSALPLPDQIESYLKTKEKLGVSPKTQGRDLSSIKGAAGTSTASMGRSNSLSFSSQEEELARNAGFKDAKTMEIFAEVKNQEQYNAFVKKHGKPGA